MKKMPITEDGKKARRDYMKEWRRKHQEKVREYAKRYWERVAERNRRKEQEKSSTYCNVNDKIEMR